MANSVKYNDAMLKIGGAAAGDPDCCCPPPTPTPTPTPDPEPTPTPTPTPTVLSTLDNCCGDICSREIYLYFTDAGGAVDQELEFILKRNCDNTDLTSYREPGYDPCNDSSCSDGDCLWQGVSMNIIKALPSGALESPVDMAINFHGACLPNPPGPSGFQLALVSGQWSCCDVTGGSCVKYGTCTDSNAPRTARFSMEVLS